MVKYNCLICGTTPDKKSHRANHKRTKKHKLQKENLNPTLQSTKGGCSYHTTKGCALTKHKSPVCISYACTSLKYELRSKYAVAYRGASISLLFEHILKGKITNQILEETIENITKATQRIKEVKAGNNPQIKKEIHIIY